MRKNRMWVRGTVTLAILGGIAAGLMLSPVSAAPRFATKKFVKKQINKLRNEFQGTFLGDTVVVTASDSVDEVVVEEKTVPCPTGYQALGGGASATNQPTVGNPLVTLEASGPAVNGTKPGSTATGDHPFANAWYVAVVGQGPGPQSYGVSVVCAKPAT